MIKYDNCKNLFAKVVTINIDYVLAIAIEGYNDYLKSWNLQNLI